MDAPALEMYTSLNIIYNQVDLRRKKWAKLWMRWKRDRRDNAEAPPIRLSRRHAAINYYHWEELKALQIVININTAKAPFHLLDRTRTGLIQIMCDQLFFYYTYRWKNTICIFNIYRKNTVHRLAIKK